MGCCTAAQPKGDKLDKMAEKVVEMVWNRYDKDNNGALDMEEVKNYVHETVRVMKEKN